MKYFNDERKLDKRYVDQITDYFKYKWDNDKNSFLETEDDLMILQNLVKKSEKTVVDLYTKFIYMTVMKRFNRFFTIKKEEMSMSTIGVSLYQYYSNKTFK